MDDQRVESDGGAPLVEYPVTERVTIVGAQPAGAMVAEAHEDGAEAHEDGSDETGAEAPGSQRGSVGEGGSKATEIGGVPAEPAPSQVPLEASTDPRAPAGSPDTGAARSVGLPPGGAPVVPDLPHWTDPPTGQVPAVLDRRGGEEADPWSTALGGGPMWREHPHEWEDMSFEPSLLGDEETQLGAMGSEERFDLAWDGDDDPEAPGVPAGSSPPGIPPGTASGGPGTDATASDASPVRGRAPSPPGGGGASGNEASGSAASSAVSSDFGATLAPAPGSGASTLRRSGPAGSRSVRRRSESSGEARPKRERKRKRQRPAVGDQEPRPRNVPLATGVGIGFAAVGLLCLKLGPLAMVSLVTVVVVVAAAEAYGAVRRAGYRPATLLGLVAAAAVVIAAYAKGLSALPLVTVIVVLATMLWYLFRVGKGSPLQGMGVTVLVFGWVGLLGSYGGLLVAPSLFPDRHGIAFIFGAIAAVVAADVGALAVGTWLGRRPLAPSVSPGKTWEGAIGGGIVAIVVSALLVGHVHPWTPASAAVLGVIAAILGPLGDLCESLVKRELKIKDMGSILPGHGGILDRVDGILFLLPATFYLVRALHLG